MEERKLSPPRNSSRTLAKVAVAVLVVIAIAGIVLASLRGRGSPAETPVAAEATQPAASAMTAAAASAAAADQAAEADAGPGKVVFAPGSVELSEAAQSKLIGIADSASKGKRAVTILGKVEAGSDTARQMELARNRANAVRGVLETHGVPLARIEIRIAQEALGLVSAKDANRVEVTLN
jgi:K(+)-stimulated pyrophosphate-energized sodium pump